MGGNHGRAPDLSRSVMPSPAVILPMQLSFNFGNCNFHASIKGTAFFAATVNSSSKSSPSVNAASRGGFAEDSARDASLAVRVMGIAVVSSSAPETRLAA